MRSTLILLSFFGTYNIISAEGLQRPPWSKPSPLGYVKRADDPIIGLDIPTGDMTITMSKDLAAKLDQALDKTPGNCPKLANRDLHSIEKRVDLPPEAVACLAAGIVVLFREMSNGALAQFRRLQQAGRVARRPHEAGALIAIANAGREIADLQPQFGLNDDDWRVLINGAFWEVYNRQVDRKHAAEIVRIKHDLQDNSDQGFCPPRELLRCSAQSCKGGDDGFCAPDALWFKGCQCEDDKGGCPTTESLPLCSACGGNNGNKCKGREDGVWKDCACIDGTTAPKGYRPWKNMQDFERVLNAFQNLPDASQDPENNNPHCELRKRSTIDVDPKLFKSWVIISSLRLPFPLSHILIPTQCRIALTQPAYYSIIKYGVCKDHPLDISESIDKTFTKDDAFNFGKYSDLKFHFKFEDRPPTCIDTCETIFNTFAMRSSCTPASDEMASKGEIELACGIASYEITKDVPPPTNPTPPTPPQACPQPWPDFSKVGYAGFDKWYADPANKCDRCPGGKFDFCAIGANTCQCTAQECVDKTQYMCYK